jgi:hypothetical protein
MVENHTNLNFKTEELVGVTYMVLIHFGSNWICLKGTDKDNLFLNDVEYENHECQTFLIQNVGEHVVLISRSMKCSFI